MSQFRTYSKYHTPEDAGMLTELLLHEGIEFEIEEPVSCITVYLGETLDPLVAVKISRDQFARVNKLLADMASVTMKDGDPDYYLFNFSDEELIDIIGKPNEWNAFDRSLAEKILQARNISVDPEYSVSKVYEPEQLHTKWLILGYIATIFGMYGIFYGLSIQQGKKTLNNGQLVPIYNKRSQWHGDLMTVLSMIFMTYSFFKVFRELIRKEQFFYFDFSAFVIT